MAKKPLLITFVLLLIIGGILVYPKISPYAQRYLFSLQYPVPSHLPQQTSSDVNIDTVSGKIQYPEDYTLVMVGDSMTENLGNSDELRAYLRQLYPDRTFEVLNYGFGSTNIVSVPERLEKTTIYGREFRPITQIDFDLILIESMGHNPLSHLSLEEGLQKQNETLDQIVSTIKTQNPDAIILFVATLAPNTKYYGKGQVDLSAEERKRWADERSAYIENHINYANPHQIPVVNIYQKSQDNNGDGKLLYYRDTDYIHPSPTGVIFISHEIARFIHENKLLPEKN